MRADMRDRVQPYALGVLTFALYAWVSPTTIVGGDNPEFSTLAVTGGRAHPSGYPLYVLWLRATSWIPAASPAHAAALSTCVLAALAVVVLHAACRAWGARPVAATLACAMFAASPLVLVFHSEAEVFALNSLIVAAVLWLAAPDGPVRGARRTLALALLAGLGLADQFTCVLVAPVGLYGAVIGVREATQRAPLVIAGAIAAFAVGLLPYLQLWLSDDTAISWGHMASFDDVLGHVLRRDYGSTDLSSRGGESKPLANVVALIQSLGRAWWWLPFAVGVGTLGWRIARPGTRSRAAWIALAASWLLAGPVFASRFNIDTAGFGIHIVQRFHILPSLVLAVPVAVGLDLLVGDRAKLAATRGAATFAPLALLVFAAPSLPTAQAAHTPVVELGMTNTLRALPEGSVMVLDGDDFTFGIVYVQQVLGIRPDVLATSWPLMGFRWYRAKFAARGLPFSETPGSPDPSSVQFADQVLAAGHALFVDDFAGKIIATHPTYPYAGLTRVLPRGAALPTLDQIYAENAKAFAAMDLDYTLPGTDDGFPTVVHMRYAETWRRIADSYHQAHFDQAAAEALARARAVGPQP